MIIKEIQSKTILSKSQVYDYVINPYVGCQHGCSFCYASFMKRFTRHKEPWGEFVDVKINAPELLKKEIKKKKRGNVWLSGVCDPYQPLERKYQLTRKCLKILVENDWPIIIQTRSPLVTRDIDVLTGSARDGDLGLFSPTDNIEVGLSIPTANDEVRKVFEPHAPPIMERIKAVETLHNSGIKTYVMIAPILPEAENLISQLVGKVDYIIVDRMNYNNANTIYKAHGWEEMNTDEYFEQIKAQIMADCAKYGIECKPAY